MKVLQKWLPQATAGLLILLFTYTGLSKLYDWERFERVLSKSALLEPFSTLLATAVPAVELVISTLLFLPRYRKAGLLSATVLMLVFTLYIAVMLFSASTLPCTCGGVVSSLSWPAHLVFNLFFLCLSIAAFLFEEAYVPGGGKERPQTSTSNALFE